MPLARRNGSNLSVLQNEIRKGCEPLYSRHGQNRGSLGFSGQGALSDSPRSSRRAPSPPVPGPRVTRPPGEVRPLAVSRCRLRSPTPRVHAAAPFPEQSPPPRRQPTRRARGKRPYLATGSRIRHRSRAEELWRGLRSEGLREEDAAPLSSREHVGAMMSGSA